MAVWDRVLRPGGHDFAMGVGSVLPRGIGEHWGGVGSANLGRLEKISWVCSAWDWHWGVFGGGMACCVSLSELTEGDDADWAGRELGRDGEDLWCWLGGVAWIHGIGVVLFSGLGLVIWGGVVLSEGRGIYRCWFPGFGGVGVRRGIE